MTSRIPDRPEPSFGARSVALSLLLGSHPPRLPTAVLVEVGGLFGIPPGTMRTALSRMAAKGEVAATHDGYQLAGGHIDRQRMQDSGRRSVALQWDHRWITVAPLRSARTLPERRDLRRHLERLGFGELRPDYWLRPANLHTIDRELAAFSPELVITMGELVVDDLDALITSLWPLDVLQSTAVTLLDESQQMVQRLERTGSTEAEPSDIGPWLVDAFTLSADIVRFLMREPRLPPSLVPRPWAPAMLRTDYDTLEAIFQRRLREFLRTRTQRTRA